MYSSNNNININKWNGNNHEKKKKKTWRREILEAGNAMRDDAKCFYAFNFQQIYVLKLCYSSHRGEEPVDGM